MGVTWTSKVLKILSDLSNRKDVVFCVREKKQDNVRGPMGLSQKGPLRVSRRLGPSILGVGVKDSGRTHLPIAQELLNPGRDRKELPLMWYATILLLRSINVRQSGTS